MVFSVQLGSDASAGKSVPLQVRVCIGETAVAVWDAEVGRVMPRSRRLEEACTALIAGAVFAQKFRFANPWVAIAGIAISIALAWPIGTVIGVIEGLALLCVRDSWYVKRLQKPWRWW